MNRDEKKLDLVVLVADRNTQAAVEGLLSRPKALGIRELCFDVFAHPQHDPGCLRKAPEFLRAQTQRYDHALVVFDRDGCGRGDTRIALEDDVSKRLRESGWQERATAIVIDPELEAWVWSESPHVDEVLRWSGRLPDLRTWLRNQGLWAAGASKPEDPKKAMHAALEEVHRPRSSAVYAELASMVSYERCEDPSFRRLREVLRNWFSSTPNNYSN